mmetsp:Transcript_1882/g.3351  ORF Transcript_1882/g.3351 Transcript_1882/m.3351 type:complete len:454 (-) Transcript_1882:140-1501(-)|eukprot:CAMPEP_0182441312 /NCGR_PEP_ID=MMETSP1172-20130603/236_1 /TAXON_ID=708627 /ORGANISM="Timspurckia oligopyrenoides, Strain CCMP3278" /LENGTH=453 /DNA_ID=CAMNT_0024635497 /DNA_START=22 /DNA_END=1383 /DNA_ORIENTATION=+
MEVIIKPISIASSSSSNSLSNSHDETLTFSYSLSVFKQLRISDIKSKIQSTHQLNPMINEQILYYNETVIHDTQLLSEVIGQDNKTKCVNLNLKINTLKQKENTIPLSEPSESVLRQKESEIIAEKSDLQSGNEDIGRKLNEGNGSKYSREWMDGYNTAELYYQQQMNSYMLYLHQFYNTQLQLLHHQQQQHVDPHSVPAGYFTMQNSQNRNVSRNATSVTPVTPSVTVDRTSQLRQRGVQQQQPRKVEMNENAGASSSSGNVRVNELNESNGIGANSVNVGREHGPGRVVEEERGGIRGGHVLGMLAGMEMNWSLILKLTFLVFLLGQEGSFSRILALVVCAVLFYLYQVGRLSFVERIAVRLVDFQRERAQRSAQQRQQQGEEGEQQGRAAVDGGQRVRYFVFEFVSFCYGLMCSLVPSWRPQQMVALEALRNGENGNARREERENVERND